jgi:hypothetical protein
MSPLPVLLVISDYPILSAAIERSLRDLYDVVLSTWDDFLEGEGHQVTLVIADVTSTGPYVAEREVAPRVLADAIVVCSLHENEIRVHHWGEHRSDVALPGLLSVADLRFPAPA